MTRTVDICHHKDQRAHYWAGQGGGYKANLASTTPLQHTGKNKLKYFDSPGPRTDFTSDILIMSPSDTHQKVVTASPQ